MIRIPINWIFYIFSLFCVIFAFHSENVIYGVIGIDGLYSFLARIGFLVFALSFFLLGFRGGIFSGSRYTNPYTDYPGGCGLYFMLLGLGSALILFGSFSFESTRNESNNTASIPSAPTSTIQTSRPTQALYDPITKGIDFNGIRCHSWEEIDESYVEETLCIFGKVYTFGPYSNKWNTIQFTPETTGFRVIDFNYEYSTPLELGECVVVYGRVRDYGQYLIISPDFKTRDPIVVYSSDHCE